VRDKNDFDWVEQLRVRHGAPPNQLFREAADHTTRVAFAGIS